MKEVQDRVVQYANRYELTNATTGAVLGTFDFVEKQGTVHQAGTPVNKELFDSIDVDIKNRVKYTDKLFDIDTGNGVASENLLIGGVFFKAI